MESAPKNTAGRQKANPLASYLDDDYVCELNKEAITLFEVKRSDRHNLANRKKLLDVLDACEEHPGDLYDKAVILLRGIVQAHAFDSGNRRTALLALFHFVELNNKKVYISDNPYNSRTLTGIREGFYTDAEIRGWIEYGTIKDFERE